MRDKRFVASHRGGPLSPEQHYQLIHWAHACVLHVLPLSGITVDIRLINALKTAKKWEEGNATVGDARNASLAAIAVARENTDPVAIAIARATGHAVATAHMADHALRAADYALKAVRQSGGAAAEQEWQEVQLPLAIKELVLSARTK